MREAFDYFLNPYCIQYEGDRVQIVEEEKAIMPMSDVIDSICKTAQGLDLVGFYAAGPQWVGYANSQGAQMVWTQQYGFRLQSLCPR